MALPIPTNPMQMMPAYVEALRVHIERELGKQFGDDAAISGVHVSADQRDTYVMVTVYGVPSVMAVAEGADEDQAGALAQRVEALRGLLRRIVDSGAAYDLTERLRDEGHRVLIHVDLDV